MGANAAPVLETSRLCLRGFVPADFDAYAAMLAKPEVHRFLGGPMERADIWNRILAGVGQWSLYGHGTWMVERLDDGQLIGTIALFHAIRDLGFDPEGVEMGWIFDSTQHGQGFAIEACTAAIEWFEDAHESVPVWAIIEPGHDASFKLAGKLGFEKVEEREFHDELIAILKRPAW